MNSSLQEISLSHIRPGHANPRSDPSADLDGLAASIGSEDSPTLVQPPILEMLGQDEYAIIAGERRILAARKAGWQSICCIVHPRLDPLQAHTLRLAENLHRKDLHPLDEAAALKIAWLTANAEAIELGAEVRAILEKNTSPSQTLAAIQELLDTNSFSSNHPAVTWETLLARLGLDLDPERRKKLMAVLNVEVSLQEQVRSLDVTEAALRSIGTLDPENQQRLVAELIDDPGLARKVRRIARVVRDGSYSMDEALAEAHGLAPGEMLPDDPPVDNLDSEDSPDPTGSDDLLLDDRPMSAAMELLEVANRLSIAMATLNDVSGNDYSTLPQPWGEYAREALDLIRSEIDTFQKGE
jgi:ParB/RepB/Spo0J family partition protein